jgi:hypothetical protein
LLFKKDNASSPSRTLQSALPLTNPGSPVTLFQAQSCISQGPLGKCIAFHRIDPISYLHNYTGPRYDAIIMCHCLWYFETADIFSHILTAAVPHTRRLCLAEWSLVASKPNAQPHVLAALLHASVEASRKVPSDGNIRTLVSPRQIKSAVAASGMQEIEEMMLQTNEGLEDAF